MKKGVLKNPVFGSLETRHRLLKNRRYVGGQPKSFGPRNKVTQFIGVVGRFAATRVESYRVSKNSARKGKYGEVVSRPLDSHFKGKKQTGEVGCGLWGAF